MGAYELHRPNGSAVSGTEITASKGAIAICAGGGHARPLSRKKNESIVIADQIRITVVEVLGDRVRLGIEAPREIPIHREEVHAAIA